MPKRPTTAAQSVEVVTAAEIGSADLRAQAVKVNETLDLIIKHEDAYKGATLEPRLLIGLEIARAQAAFGMTNAQAGALGGDAKASVSRRDTLETKPTNPGGFAGWIKQEIPRLGRTTAIKYANAFAALGIPAAEATPAKIKAKIKDLHHLSRKNNLPPPSVDALSKLGKPAALIGSGEEPEDSETIRIGDAREAFDRFRELFDKNLTMGHLDNLPKEDLKSLHEFLQTCRDRVKARLK